MSNTCLRLFFTSPTTTRRFDSILCVSIFLLVTVSCSAHETPFLSATTTQTGIMRSFLAGVLLLMLPFLALGFVPRLPSKGLANKVSAPST